MATVELRDVGKTYGETPAVSNLTLRIDHGEFVALLGPSGCGKTTTLQMLAGFVEPTSGDILVDGQSMRGTPPHKRNVGVVFQSYALFPHLNVFDNVGFGLRMRGVAPSKTAERVRHALDLVQLVAMDHRLPRELSGGQQQRVALARALVIEPSVLLLDEPLSNLDANLREQMRFEIREIQKRIGITTVFVTHDQTEAMAAADRLVIMSKGEIRQIGTARDIYEAPVDTFVAGFIGQANLLRGEVKEIGNGTAQVSVAGSKLVKARPRNGVRPGQPAVLALRPEDLRIATQEQPQMNNLPGLVSRVNYLGSSINAGIRIGDMSVAVTRPRGETAPSEGDQVYIYWPPDTGVLLEVTRNDAQRSGDGRP